MKKILAALGAMLAALAGLGAFLFGRKVERGAADAARAKAIAESSADDAEADRRAAEREVAARLAERKAKAAAERALQKPDPTRADADVVITRLEERRRR